MNNNDIEFIYTSFQEGVHLTTVPPGDGFAASSEVGERLSGNLRCTNGGLCEGLGRHTLIGVEVDAAAADHEGDKDDEQGLAFNGGLALAVRVGGLVFVESFNPDGSIKEVNDNDGPSPPTFTFTCPATGMEVPANRFDFDCVCDSSGGTCDPEKGLEIIAGNPVQIQYTGNCNGGFSALIYLECVEIESQQGRQV